MASESPNDPAAKRVALFHIPSHAEVASASRPAPPTIYFRPSSVPLHAQAQPRSGSPPSVPDQGPTADCVASDGFTSAPLPVPLSTHLQSIESGVGQPTFSGSFSDAFSFVRQTEHYTAPAPPAPLPAGHAFNSGARCEGPCASLQFSAQPCTVLRSAV